MNVFDSENQPVRLRARTEILVGVSVYYFRLLEHVVKIELPSPRSLDFLKLLYCGGKPSEIRRQLDLAPDSQEWIELKESLEYLIREGFCELVAIPHKLHMSDVARFDRLIHYLSPFETPEYSRYDRLASLLHSHVCLLGLGGIGSWILHGLACHGVRNLTLVDFDVVELSNLNRSIAFDESMIGWSKIEAACTKLRRFWPQLNLTEVECKISSEQDVLNLIDGHDLVISQVDSPPELVNFWVTRACRIARVPLLPVSSLQVGPLTLPGCPPCLLCYREAVKDRVAAYITGPSPVQPPSRASIAATGMITAGVACREVFRFLSKAENPLTLNSIWVMDDRTCSASLSSVKIHSRCPSCANIRI